MKYLFRVFIIVICISSLFGIKASAEEKKYITALEFVKELEKITKEFVLEDTYKNDEFLKRVDAAVLLDSIYTVLYDDKYDEALYETVVSKNRISDINKISKGKQPAVLRCFVRGLMKGYSPGKCTQQRVFKGNQNITVDEAKECIERLKKETSRVMLSPDGQVIRTSNLPLNAKDYPYILESFPNDFYEMVFWFNSFDWASYEPKEQRSINEALKNTEYKKLEGQPGWYKSNKDPCVGNYCTPAKINKMATTIFFASWFLDEPEHTFYFTAFQNKRKVYETGWCQMIEDYLMLRYNVNYTDKKWIDAFIKYQGDSSSVKEYIKNIKKNKVILECKQVTVEPSTMYDANGIHIRTYVKFRVKSASSLKDMSKVLYKDYMGSAPITYDYLKIGEWKELYVDYEVATNVARYEYDVSFIDDYNVLGYAVEDKRMKNRMKGPISDYKVEQIKTGEGKGNYHWVYKKSK